MSTAKECLRFSGLFEAELLLELMLRFWEHPSGSDEEFRQMLIERASEVLQQSVAGTVLIAGMASSEVNFVAAVWYAEWSCISDRPDQDPDGKRQAWLEKVRRAVPSCFCSQDDLG